MATAAGCDDRSGHTDRRPAESYLQDASNDEVSRGRSPSRSNSRNRGPGDDDSRSSSPRNGYGSDGSAEAFAVIIGDMERLASRRGSVLCWCECFVD